MKMNNLRAPFGRVRQLGVHRLHERLVAVEIGRAAHDECVSAFHGGLAGSSIWPGACLGGTETVSFA